MEDLPRRNSEIGTRESHDDLESHATTQSPTLENAPSETADAIEEDGDSDDDDFSDSDVTTASEDESDDGHDHHHHDHDDYDLATRITNQIKNDEYVCLICTCEVETDARMWSCTDCYRVYHIECIDSWSKKGSSTDDHGNWKCPACNSTHRKQKFQHRCWCKKVINPEENDLNPGSCGQTCGAKLEGCVHRCTLPCHPGPHAACNALGPEFRCHCGNHTQQWPCVLTPYVEGWQCEDICPEFMSCEVHKCNKICHQGLCGKCEEFMESKCYCGKTTDMVKCHARNPQRSYGKGKNPNWIGNFQCPLESDVHYDCNVHSKALPCQPVNKKSLHCPLSVDVITTCHCGQTPTDAFNMRTKCTDPIPTCDEICNKTLPCGHQCKWKCHGGECSPCIEALKTKCVCGNHNFIVPCKFVQEGHIPTCTRKCFALMSCRRHTCNKICCANEQAALARERARKRTLRTNAGRPNSRETNETFSIEANHICLEICNRKLTCGNPDHICKRTCHAGGCPPCLESSNDDLVCHCGKTVMLAPIRCGRKLPPCEHQCVRDLPCGHTQMPHHCHEDNDECPKCTKTVEKRCNCGKNAMKAMCYQEEVFCAERCGKVLPCKHHCMMSCHKEEVTCECKSICGLRKKFCSHVDRRKCHYPEPCNSDHIPCAEKVELVCGCGRVKKSVACGANHEHDSVQGTVLDCEVSCVLKEREERLQAAFGIAPSSTPTGPKLEDLPYVVDALKTTIIQNKWCLNTESIFKKFMTQSTDKTHHFPPMRREQRKFIHEMAEAYGLKSEAHDPEPRRSIVITRTKDAKIPEFSLMDAIDIYQDHIAEQKVKAAKAKAEALKSASGGNPAEEEEDTEFNAFAITDCIHGVTIPDLQHTISPAFEQNGVYLKFHIKWVTDDLYLIIFEKFMKLPKVLESRFEKISSVLRGLLQSHFLANTVNLVKINEFETILKVKKAEEKSEKEEDLVSSTNDLSEAFDRVTKEVEDLSLTSSEYQPSATEARDDDTPISIENYTVTEEDSASLEKEVSGVDEDAEDAVEDAVENAVENVVKDVQKKEQLDI